MKPTVYTVEEAADRMRLQPATVQGYCRDGRIPCVVYGKAYRIKRETIEALERGTIKVKRKVVSDE